MYAPRGALDAVLALDRPGMLADAYVLHEFTAGDRFDIGPFHAHTCLLPHWVERRRGAECGRGTYRVKDRAVGESEERSETLELARV